MAVGHAFHCVSKFYSLRISFLFPKFPSVYFFRISICLLFCVADFFIHVADALSFIFLAFPPIFPHVADFPLQALDWVHLFVCVLSQITHHSYQKYLEIFT